MAKFVYRMQNILDIKNKLEVQARNSYAAARMKLSQEEEKLDRMFEQKKAYEENYRQQLSGNINILQINICKNAIAVQESDKKAACGGESGFPQFRGRTEAFG